MTQVHTVPVSVAWIMKSPEFAIGLEEARNGGPFDWRNGSWEYERGRLFGHIAPTSMPLRIAGRLNPKAIVLFELALKRSLIT
ncbi:hypothetical protein RAD15_05035 [Bradyrhizobium sp. 14AA]